MIFLRVGLGRPTKVIRREEKLQKKVCEIPFCEQQLDYDSLCRCSIDASLDNALSNQSGKKKRKEILERFDVN